MSNQSFTFSYNKISVFVRNIYIFYYNIIIFYCLLLIYYICYILFPVRNFRNISVFLTFIINNLFLEGINSEQPMKKQSASERLSDSNKVAQNMVDLTSKKLNIKSNYYDQKLILLQQKNNILSKMHTLLETYIQNKM